MSRFQGGGGPPSFDPAKLKASATADNYSSSDSGDEDEDEFMMPSRNPNDDAFEFADHHNQHARKRRRTGRDAKESAALGIFGSDSEDDRGGGRRWKSKRPLRSKGVSFVSSGKKVPGSDDDENAEEEEEEDGEEEEEDGEMDEDGDGEGAMNTMKAAAAAAQDEDEDEDEEEAGGVGLGFGGGAAASASQGLGWMPPTQQPQSFVRSADTSEKPSMKSTYDGKVPLGSSFTPSSAKAPVLKVKDDGPSTPRAAMPSAFSHGKGGKTKLNPKSFGARMMAKMGFVEGKGLGAEGTGRSAIIEAVLRPQNIGLGAVKEKTEQERQEEKRQRAARGEVVTDSEEEERKKKAARKKKTLPGGIRSGTGSGTSTPRRQKPKYLTMDEIKKAAPGLNIPEAFTPILDMTGPGPKMLTSSSGIMTPSAAPATEETPEAAESRKLAKRAQNDLMAILEEWQSLQERKAYIDLQLSQERQEIEELASSIEANLAITNACAKLSESAENGLLDRKADLTYQLTEIVSGLKAANDAVSASILPQVKEELALAAVAAIHPAFKEYLQLWDPLQEPSPPFVEGLLSIRDLLGLTQRPKKSHRKSTATPYETMMFKLWLPRIAAVIREWNVRDSDPLLALVEAWQDLMPGFVRAQLLEQDVVRKLEEAVAKWEPKRRKHNTLPHVWIFPWLQYLPAHHLDPRSSTGLVADVKRKFRQLIDVWEFDRGVVPGLKQWKDILRPDRHHDQWAPLVMNHVLPSMARYLKANLDVNPQDQQNMEAIAGVCEWTEVVSAAMIGEVMVEAVFPKWHDVLYRWLVLEEANYDEIGQWFQWWQDDVFPDDIKALPSIVAEFEKGTALIEQALNLGEDAKTRLKPPEQGPALQIPKPEKEKEKHRHHKSHHHPRQQAAAKAQQQPEEVTFRHVVEDWCLANDLQFIPERKKVHAEGPLYRITARGDGKGGVLAYFKGDILVVEIRNQKDPVRFHRGQESEWGLLLELAS